MIPNTSLSPANTRIRSLMGPRWYGSHRCKELEGYSRITRDTYNELSRRRSGLIIHNENNELDDDFLHDGDVETERPKINGGTILRKELRAKQMLTKDEALSWDLFEEARSTSNTTPHYSIHETNSERNILRRKRKKITPILSASPGSYSGTRPSRISILINQLKRSENKDSKLPGSTLGGYDTLSTPGRSISSGNDSKGLKVNKAPDVSLSLEQKQEVQKYVRDRLKPLYQPNAPDGERETLIRSQEEYVKINKKVSRRIYCYILSLGEFSNIFEDEQCLKSIIYQHLDEVLKLLSISN